MTFIDPQLASYQAMSNVKGPAFFLPLNHVGYPMLVAGGADPSAIFLEGKWKGECFSLMTAEDWQGMVVAGVSIEVDPSSAYAPDDGEKEPLTVIRRGDGVGVMAILKSAHPFTQKVMVQLDGEASGSGARLGFRRWRIGLRRGNEFITLWEAVPAVNA